MFNDKLVINFSKKLLTDEKAQLENDPIFSNEVTQKAKEKPRNHCGYRVFFGAAGQIRTADLILTKDALCLLSYSSKGGDSEGT